MRSKTDEVAKAVEKLDMGDLKLLPKDYSKIDKIEEIPKVASAVV
jgi:hypothetical protein